MISFRYTPQQRLKTGAEFKTVLADAKRFSSPLLNVFCRKNELKYPRLGLSVAKRRLKRAVDRNLVKRQVRECFRQHQHELDGVDLVVIYKQATARPNKQEIRQCFEKCWQQLKRFYAAH